MHGVDVCTLLKGDHEALRSLLEELAHQPDAEARRLRMRAVRRELDVHRTLAEDVFYPAVRDAIGETAGLIIAQHAREEHEHADRAMRALEDTDPHSAAFRERLEVLRSLVARHIDEEEAQVFRRVRERMDSETMQEVGKRLNERRLQLERLYPGGRVEHMKEAGRA